MGTVRNTIITSDMMRAISRPSKRSRTMATAITRAAEAPTPWITRATMSSVKLSVTRAMTLPTA